MIIDWDTLFMSMAHLVGMKSRDKNTQIGAVIVDKNNAVVSVGYNGLPIGVEYTEKRQSRPEKYYWFSHAERNAIYLAKRDLANCKMYTNGTPCADCAHGIIQSGILEVIVNKMWEDSCPEKWAEHAERSKEMFYEANIKLRIWSGEIIRNINNRLDGEYLYEN